MKFDKTTQFLRYLQRRLGNDLVYSLALDGSSYSLGISAHKSSKRSFKDGNMQVVRFTTADLDKDILMLSHEIANIVEQLLVKTNDNTITRS